METFLENLILGIQVLFNKTLLSELLTDKVHLYGKNKVLCAHHNIAKHFSGSD